MLIIADFEGAFWWVKGLIQNKKNHTMIISIGSPIMPQEIALYPDAEQLGKFLQDKTYALAKNK